MMQWNNELVFEFLNLYENNPVIWNPSYASTRTRFDVADAWSNIQNQLSVEVDIDSLKKKKECLMATYRTLKKRIKESAKTASGDEDIYTPTWFAYETMDRFLSAKNNAILITEDNTNNDDNDELEPDGNDSYFEAVKPKDNGIANDSTKSLKTIIRATKHPSSIKRKSNRPTKYKTKKLIKLACNALQTSDEPAPPNIRDECTLYGELLAIKLKRLDGRTRAIVTNEIDNILFHAQMEQFSFSVKRPKQKHLNYSQPLRACNPQHTETSSSQGRMPNLSPNGPVSPSYSVQSSNLGEDSCEVKIEYL